MFQRLNPYFGRDLDIHSLTLKEIVNTIHHLKAEDFEVCDCTAFWVLLFIENKTRITAKKVSFSQNPHCLDSCRESEDDCDFCFFGLIK
jgi:hypothetical protein